MSNSHLTVMPAPEPKVCAAVPGTRAAPPLDPAHYVLQPGLERVADPPGGLLVSTRPLVAMRINSQAWAVLGCLGVERTAAEVAAMTSLTPGHAEAFLESLARKRLLRKRLPIPTDWPAISVIVPARGRPAATRACVASLLALDYPRERLEILVIDDASEPPLAAALAGLPIRLLRQDHNIGQSAARNLAAKQAQGSVLAFIDNDCEAHASWLKALVPYLSEPAMGVVGGRIDSPSVTGWIAAYESVCSPLDMGEHGGEVGPAEAVAYLPTCNLLVDRSLMLNQGGFDPAMKLGEDVDFVWRAIRAGARACYAPGGRVVHHHRVRLAALLSRRADYGSSEADLQLRFPEGRRIMRLPLTVGAGLAALVTASVSWITALFLAIATLAALTLETITKRQRIHRMGLKLPAGTVLSAVGRGHWASLYHLSAHVSRYYSLPLLIGGLLWTPLLPMTAVLLLIAPVSDYRRLRPRLPLPMFVGLSCLEMAAYQLGVWRGCFKQRTLRPWWPKVRWIR
ncbi:MAG: mycofactocin biosynthesis glycosyltransferase MftF [Gammaproteobacteria bacterium]|nr:mycofactocin biosynthesis glycosyltransferase MftF [Gammaproteobacteria bacterium]